MARDKKGCQVPKVSEAHLEQRRQQILEAAVTCFARKGFDKTTMAEIAAEAGVSDTLAYRYFTGKKEIIDAAIRHHEGRLSVDELGESEGGVDDLRTLLDMLLTSSIRRFDDREEIEATMGMYFRMWAEALHDEKRRTEVLERWNHHFEVAEGLVTRAQERGQLAKQLDPRSVTWVMLATHYGLNVLAVLNPDIELDKCRDVMLAMSFGGFVTGEQAGQGV